MAKLRATVTIGLEGAFHPSESTYNVSLHGESVLDCLMAVEAFCEAVRTIEQSRDHYPL